MTTLRGSSSFCSVTQYDYGEVKIEPMPPFSVFQEFGVHVYGYLPDKDKDVMVFAAFDLVDSFIIKAIAVVKKGQKKAVLRVRSRLLEIEINGDKEWPVEEIAHNDYRVYPSDKLNFSLPTINDSCGPTINYLTVHDQVVGDMRYNSYGPGGDNCKPDLNSWRLSDRMPNPIAGVPYGFLMYNTDYGSHLKWGLSSGLKNRLYYDGSTTRTFQFVPHKVSNPDYPFIQYGDQYMLKVDGDLASSQIHMRGLRRDEKPNAIFTFEGIDTEYGRISGMKQIKLTVLTKKKYANIADCPSLREDKCALEQVGLVVCCPSHRDEFVKRSGLYVDKHRYCPESARAAFWHENGVAVAAQDIPAVDETWGYVGGILFLLFCIIITVYILKNVQ